MASGIMFLDLETENHEYFGNMYGSPKHPDNYVVMEGHAVDYQPYAGEVRHTYFKDKDVDGNNWLKIPKDVWLLVAHNLSYELDWGLTRQYQEIAEFVKRGGKFWCTQLAEYRLSRQEHIYPSLEECAIKYGGDPKIDAVKLEWEAGKLTSEIDVDLLRDYLVGTPDMEGDIGNTRLVFYGQWVEATERGMLDALLEQNNALLYNAVCMSNGLKIDREVGDRNLARLNERLLEVDTLLKDHRSKAGIQGEAAEAFKMTSDFHISAWLYGGTLRYDGKVQSIDKDGNPRYDKMDVVYNAEDPHEYVKVDTSQCLQAQVDEAGFFPTVFKSGKRKGEIKVERRDSNQIKMINGKVDVVLKGIINLNALPEEFLESWLDKYTQSRELGCGTPVYSSSEDAIGELAVRRELSMEAKEVLTLMREWAILNKVVGSFFDREEFYANGNPRRRSGIFQYITDQGLIHHSLNPCATKTGRLSSTRPNLQQIPRDDREGVMQSNVKEMFVSRFGEDGLILEIDFNALEVRGMADFANDTALQEAILNGTDMHSLRAAAYHGWDYEEFNTRRNIKDDPMYEQLNQWRQDIKSPSFAYQYGATAYGIAFATGWSVQDAEKFIETERAMFPDVEVYFAEVAERIEKTRQYARALLDNGAYNVYYTGYLKADSGFEYAYRSRKRTRWDRGKPYEVDEFAPTEMRNYIIQGDSSFFVQVVTGKLIRHYFAKDFYGGKLFPINTVHDQVLLDVHKDVLEEVVRDTIPIMEAIPKWMKPLGYDLQLPYPVEATAGLNWQDQKKMSEFNINL